MGNYYPAQVGLPGQRSSVPGNHRGRIQGIIQRLCVAV